MATIESDIVVLDRGLGNPSALDAHLADPNRLWPSGVVEYKFYHTFPFPRMIVRRAMDYITSKASCITFQEATEDTVDYVLIRDGADMCNSELGRTGGKQEINLNR